MTKAQLRERLEGIGLQLDEARAELEAAESKLASAKAGVVWARAKVTRLLMAREQVQEKLEAADG